MEKDQLQEEIQLMSEVNKIQDARIKLDIGGHIYATSILTLTKDPQSMLAAMFSGRHSVKKEEDGSYFIDRDGTHFRYILNYLRDGGFKDGTLPGDILTELQTEAEYYQLSGLVDLIQSILSERLNEMGESRIKLDIGGHVYATSVSTLRDSDSMLADMFSRRHPIKKQEDGSYFIDRDGTHFRYILNCLRDGGFKEGMLPSDSDTRTELLREAQYYQLRGLVALLRRILSERLNA